MNRDDRNHHSAHPCLTEKQGNAVGVQKATPLLQEDIGNSFQISLWDHKQLRNLKEVVAIFSGTFP